MVNNYNSENLRNLGYAVEIVEDEYCIISNMDSKSEIIIWKLGDWVQFQCMAFNFEIENDSVEYLRLIKSINKIHEIALGARIVVNDGGEISVISDLLHSVIDDDIVARTCDQILFICDRIYRPLESACRNGSLSTADVDEIFS